VAGYCNVSLPRDLLPGDLAVLLDGVAITPTITENATHTTLHLEYTLSSHQVEIVGAAGSLLTLPTELILMIGAACILLVVVLILRRRSKPKTPSSRLDDFLERAEKEWR